MTRSKQSIKPNTLRRDGFLFEYVARGSIGPTVIFESGLGDGLAVWSHVVDKLGDVRSFSYNRAGYGKSYLSHKERCGRVIAEELHTLLHELNYLPPYVLVAHSLGAAYAAVFAQKYPEEVHGLVLIDPMTIEMDELCKNDGIKEWDSSLFSKVMIAIFLSRGAKRELKMREESLAQARTSSASANSFPVVVVSADKGMGIARLQRAWLSSHELLVRRYSNCSHVVVNSGHHIQKDNPDVVVDQILATLKSSSVVS